jgi:hypothetical protein
MKGIFLGKCILTSYLLLSVLGDSLHQDVKSNSAKSNLGQKLEKKQDSQ